MSKKTTDTTTRNELIKQYRNLGADMKTLRTDHIAEVNALIEKYKADKKEIQSQREELLKQIRNLTVEDGNKAENDDALINAVEELDKEVA